LKERAIVFGQHRGLMGIVAEPSAVERQPVAVLLWNVGTHHRVGPFRLNVELARRLAVEGYPVLRFDLSGLGDSEPRPGAAMADHERHMLDVREAMDWMEANAGVNRFVLVGLCSGVDSAHPLARDDARVAGAVFIDGYLYPTRGFWFRRYHRGLIRRWLRAVAVRLAERRIRQSRELGRDERNVFDRHLPTLEEFRADVARMTDRGARVLFVNTGNVVGVFNDAEQMYETLGTGARRDLIRSELFPEADHLFTATRLRAELGDLISDWLRSGWPASTRGRTPEQVTAAR
jgi:pimeloyl-ACP methyl ester carboxylesterase